MARSYTVRVRDIEKYELGRQPEGWWVVAIDRENSTITYAYDNQVAR